MRCTFIDFKSLYAKHKKIIEDLETDLIRRASDFYNSSVMGIPVVDLAHSPDILLIDEVVLNTIVDLDRIKNYHPVDNPSRYKYAAYLCFWWERMKPFSCKLRNYSQLQELSQKLKTPAVSVEDASFVVLDIVKSINEIFICDCVLDAILISSNQATVCDDSGNKLVGYNDIRDSLEYFLRYRTYNAQSLELFLKGFNACPMDIASMPVQAQS